MSNPNRNEIYSNIERIIRALAHNQRLIGPELAMLVISNEKNQLKNLIKIIRESKSYITINDYCQNLGLNPKDVYDDMVKMSKYKGELSQFKNIKIPSELKNQSIQTSNNIKLILDQFYAKLNNEISRQKDKSKNSKSNFFTWFKNIFLGPNKILMDEKNIKKNYNLETSNIKNYIAFLTIKTYLKLIIYPMIKNYPNKNTNK